MVANSFEVFLGTFNAAPWIERVISSLENQTYGPFKVNIVDNDSTDETTSIVQNFLSSKTLKNEYRLIKNSKNIGAISSFFDQQDLFQSDWLVMIHQDDEYHPNHIQTLVDGMNSSASQTSVVFTAMKRINGEGIETLPLPTLAPKLSEHDRLSNVLTTIQINPVNFPASAIRKQFLEKVQTTKHTTAFNDTELMIRLMCISDIKYLPIETMHYRVFEGNAASITKVNANDRATLVGLNEIIHSNEFRELISPLSTKNEINRIVQAFDDAIEIRISQTDVKKIAKEIISEALIRLFGYKNNDLANFLKKNLIDNQLVAEAKIVENLNVYQGYEELKLLVSTPKALESNPNLGVIRSNNFAVHILNRIPLSIREKLFFILVKSPIFIFAKRPFIKTWRS
jgi:glycosyltransferase involved in cell wall biosynthesis